MTTGATGTDDASASSVAANVNVGVLGHVDSGKTHLVRALSTHLSTAALDKHPQSQARGMTIDLGFSALTLAPDEPNGPSRLQVTLVDCPGHASLFRTILGGAAIIDSVLLVVDALRGLQPQTIECLLVAHVAGIVARGGLVLVALNKIDLLPPGPPRAAALATRAAETRAFLRDHLPTLAPATAVEVVGVSATTGEGLDALLAVLRGRLRPPARDPTGPLCLAIDHCFAIPGNGTILTGTVRNGRVAVGDDIALPGLGVTRRVKSLQSFRRPVATAWQGDRVAVRVHGLDPALVERGVAVTPGSLPFVHQVVVPVRRIALFHGACRSGAKVHATIGHTTVVAVATFFARFASNDDDDDGKAFDPLEIYEHVAEIPSPQTAASVAKAADDDGQPSQSGRGLFALLQFEQPVICPPQSVVVCSRLDLDPKRHHCRLAFYGPIAAVVGDGTDERGCQALGDAQRMVAPTVLRGLAALRIGRVKERRGLVDKVLPTGNLVLGRDMFAKDVDWDVYGGTTVLLTTSRHRGTILGPFGKSGKFRVALTEAASGQRPPIAGEIIVLRFIKLHTLRPLRHSASAHAGSAPKQKHAPTTQPTTARGASKTRLLQDLGIVYPEEHASDDLPVESACEAHEHVTAASPSPPMPQSMPGRVERLKGETTSDGRNPVAIVSGLFSSDLEATTAVGRRVLTFSSSDKQRRVEYGVIDKPFGKAGKVRVEFRELGGTLAQVGDAVGLVQDDADKKTDARD